MTITNFRDQLIRDEGCKLTAYKDSLGNWTVGVGHKIGYDCGTITQEQADAYLTADIAHTELLLAHALLWAPDLELEDPIRYSALVNMGFNMGVGGLLQFHFFLGFMQENDFASASKSMLVSQWAKQVGPRATRLSQQVLTGTYQ